MLARCCVDHGEFLTGGCSSDGIDLDRPKSVEWLNNVVQKHINSLESDLLGLASSPFVHTETPGEVCDGSFDVAEFGRVVSSDSG